MHLYSLASILCVQLKTEASFEIMAYIKGNCCVNLANSGTHTYNELCQIHETSAVSKRSVFSCHKIFGMIKLTLKMAPSW